jgi:hypothetical protein
MTFWHEKGILLLKCLNQRKNSKFRPLLHNIEAAAGSHLVAQEDQSFYKTMPTSIQLVSLQLLEQFC